MADLFSPMKPKPKPMRKLKPAAVAPAPIAAAAAAAMPNVSPLHPEIIGFAPNRKNNMAAAAARAATLRNYELGHAAARAHLARAVNMPVGGAGAALVGAAPVGAALVDVAATPMRPKPVLNIANARRRKSRKVSKSRKNRQ
jgi:hypothetical protein